MEPHYSTLTKLFISGAVYYTNFSFGCVLNIISPLVIAFSEKFHTDVPSVSIVFSVLTGSYLVSALTSAFVYRYANRHACTIFLMALVSTAVFLMPHVTSIYLFYVLGGLVGLGSGGFDTAQITWIIEIWRNQAAPFILTQHFSYAIATILPPLLLGPYLNSDGGGGPNNNGTNLTTTLNDDDSMGKNPPNLFVPFTAVGTLVASSALIHIILFCHLLIKKPKDHPAPDRQSLLNSSPNASSSAEYEGGSSSSSISPGGSIIMSTRTIGLVILSCCIIGFYQGLEMTTMQFFPTFCVYAKVALSQAEGAQVLFALTMAFAVGRALGILVVLKVPPQFIIWANFTLILTANFILFLWGQDFRNYLWIGAIILGAGCSTVYPAFYAFIERHVHITNGIVACITVSGGLVAAIYPLIVGNFVKDNPSILNYVIFCSLSIIVTSFAITNWMTRAGRRRRNGGESLEPTN